MKNNVFIDKYKREDVIKLKKHFFKRKKLFLSYFEKFFKDNSILEKDY